MQTTTTPQADNAALESAAKYICTMKCGMCPMTVEQFPCPQSCTLDVQPWQCWISYFRHCRQPPGEQK